MENKIIPYGKHEITESDINAVINILKSDFLTQGPGIKEFELQFSKYVGSKYAVAVANGTAALHLCTIALGVEKGDKVITTPITFVASANCIRYCEGEVVFADIDPRTYLIDINKVKALLDQSPVGTYKGLIVVDFAGLPVNMEEFKNLANHYNLWIIEDACHAPGGFFKDSNSKLQSCGNSKYADLSIFSFHPVKHIATGEGGMITTDDEKLYNKLIQLRTHGITRNESYFINSIDDVGGVKNYPNWYMEMQNLGFNYRMTDFQAALGISQLNRAEEGLRKRKYIALKYTIAFKNQEFIIGQSGYIEGHAYHLYIIEVRDRLGLYNYLRECGILTQIHYFPCHLMPYYKQFGWKAGDMPSSEDYYNSCISLPIYPSLTEEDQNFVIQKISEYYTTNKHSE
jgi:UDP-4-amino-4,6-dideoxy-N-acetyl-beta-L-altrosamine transaminase